MCIVGQWNSIGAPRRTTEQLFVKRGFPTPSFVVHTSLHALVGPHLTHPPWCVPRFRGIVQHRTGRMARGPFKRLFGDVAVRLNPQIIAVAAHLFVHRHGPALHPLLGPHLPQPIGCIAGFGRVVQRRSSGGSGRTRKGSAGHLPVTLHS